jgi:hypothetical protein
MALAPIVMPILSVFKSGGVKEASAAVQGLGAKFGELVKTATKAAGALAGFQAIASAKEFVNTSIDATQRFERNLLALQQTFETATPALTSFIKEVEDYGLSQQQAAQASVFLGSVLKQYGFSTKEAGVETKKLVTLSQDLATTYGYDVQDALLAVTALFRGEYDPIEKFGVAMKQNEINAYLAAKGLGDLTGAELANAQATARLDLLFQRAADSVGAFTRASDTLYGSQQRLNAVMGNLQVAFGSAFQKPLADVNNALANVAQDGGGQLVDISRVLGETIGYLVPTIEDLGTLVVNLVAPLEQVVGFFGVLASGVLKVLNPAIDIANIGLDMFNNLLDGATNEILAFNEAIQDDMGRDDFADFINGITFADRDYSFENTVIGGWIAELQKFSTDKANQNILEKALLRPGLQLTEMRKDASIIERFAEALELARLEASKLAGENTRVTDLLRSIGEAAGQATGQTSSLSSVFEELDDVIAKSEAKEALEGLGLSAGLIEKVLTDPNWEQIFGDISRLAYLTSLDLANMFILDVLVAKADIAAINERLGKAFIIDEKKVSSTNKEKVTTIFDDLKKMVMQQTARAQLEQMTGSEGLINMILGREDWLSLWIKIKSGLIPLEDLEKQFYKTAEGAQELADTAQAWDDYRLKVQALKDELEETKKAINAAADALKLSFSDMFSAFDVLPTIAIEMGRFESAIVAQLGSIEAALQSAFRNGDLFEEGYNALRTFARQELSVLQSMQRQRDDMANRFSLSKAIIDEYRTAFTGAMQLTSLFNSLKDETEKRTVTEVTKGVIKLGEGLREFNVIVTRDYEETITKVMDKTAGLLDGFRAMAAKSRDFANNLRVLKDMGLDGQLFDQLVSAGVEAGGETAQALVDGGQETVSEISNIFAEVNALGATLGEEVATTLYGTGIDLADGLIEGILSKQDEMEKAAYAMAEAFNSAFQATLSTEIGKVTDSRIAEATQNTADAIAAIPVPAMPKPIDQAALDKINSLIAGATRYIGNVSGALFEGGTAKLGIYEALAADIAAGGTVDVSGIKSGMSSSELLAASKATGSTTVNQYFTIEPGNRTQQNQTVETLRTFTNQNGALSGFVKT